MAIKNYISFSTNVPGQIAISRSLNDSLEKYNNFNN